MKIVFLDAKTFGEDIDLSGYNEIGEVVKYDATKAEEVAERVQDADVIVVNKVLITEETVGNAKNLKLVCVTATGTNNLDKEFLDRRGIQWRNVAGYSTETVAQHTFAMFFYLAEKMRYYDDYVKEEQYVKSSIFSHFSNEFHELSGQTWGIIGLGSIGKRVAELAKAFGCNVIYYSTSGKNQNQDYRQVDFDTLLAESDIISVHAPLDENTQGLMDEKAFRKMKKSAIFLNLGRGPIVVEEDLANALENGEIQAAGLDVLCEEPMRKTNPLIRIKDSNRLVITPHIAWASVEARTRLMKVIQNQIKEYLGNEIPYKEEKEDLKEVRNLIPEVDEEPKVLLFAGDSVTDSNRLWGEDPRGLGEGYVLKIADTLEKNLAVKVVNKGFNGFMVQDLKSKWKSILETDPDVVTILIGINDVGLRMGNNLSIEQLGFKKDYEYLIKETQSKTKAKIILMSPFVFSQMNEYVGWRPLLEEHVDVVKELAEKYQLPFIDLDGIFIDITKKYGFNSLTTDGIHLTPYGHTVIAEEWCKVYNTLR